MSRRIIKAFEYSLLLVFLCLSFFSCVPENTKVYLDKISILEKKLDTADQLYKEIDLEQLAEIQNKMKKETEILKVNWEQINHSDTAEGKYIHAYFTLYKTMSRFYKYKPGQFGDRIEKKQNQLSNLKHDLKNQIITNSDSINYYINLEQKDVLALIIQVENSNVLYNNNMQRYALLEPQVVEYLNKEIK